MSGQYGQSFASKLLQAQKYAEALAEATRAIGLEADDPENYLDRASALVELDRSAESIPDFIRALELDEEVHVLETDFVDDAYFSALLDVARKGAVDAGVQTLQTYLTTLPAGRHVSDVRDWQRRLTGELQSEFVKRRVED